MGLKKLFAGAVPTSAGSAEYTVPSGYYTKVVDINICNTTGNTIQCALHLVTVGGSASTSNMLIPNAIITGNQFIQWTGELVMNAGDFIQAIGSSAGLAANITGEEIRVSV